MRQQFRYSNIIQCDAYPHTIPSSPGKHITAWGATITLLVSDIPIDYIYVLRNEFPFSDYLRVSRNKIEIVNALAIDHLRSVCYQFSVYVWSLLKFSTQYDPPPMYWSEEYIYLWKELAFIRLAREGV